MTRYYTTVASNITVGAVLVDLDVTDAALRGSVFGARVLSSTFVEMFGVVEFQVVRPDGTHGTFVVRPDTIVEVDEQASAAALAEMKVLEWLA